MKVHQQSRYGCIQTQVREYRWQFSCISAVLPKGLCLLPRLSVQGILAIIFPTLLVKMSSEEVKMPNKKANDRKKVEKPTL